jgi:hypothetical protein
MITLVEAIGRMEGVLLEGSRPNRNNNPGDIEFGEFARIYGATNGDPRFAIFPTMEMGYAALTALLKTHEYKNLTVTEAIARYAPPVENNDTTYVDDICTWVGCQPDTPISTLV